MRPTLFLPAFLGTLVAADFLSILEIVRGGGRNQDRTNAIWHSNNGAFDVNADNGCRGVPVPSVNEFCMDWDQNRGHFLAQGQPKRCFQLWKSTNIGSCMFDNTNACYIKRVNEVPCSW